LRQYPFRGSLFDEIEAVLFEVGDYIGVDVDQQWPVSVVWPEEISCTGVAKPRAGLFIELSELLGAQLSISSA
jgi:hypothetical protein